MSRIEYLRQWRLANREKCREYARRSYATHAEKRREYGRQARAADPEKHRARHRRSRYGLTPEGYAWMFEQQGGACATCPADASVVDHCHETGAVRALLCRRCNYLQGLVEATPETIVRLQQFTAATASEPAF